MRFVALIACAVMLIGLGISPGHADKRVALVIGNSNYLHAGQLPNPVGDAAALAALLKASGFQVVEHRSNVALADMRRAVSDFADAARDADLAIVYYAGHGIEVDGVNYLIPTDATLARDFDVEDETISLDRVLKAIDGAWRLRLVILDACRDNPFAQSMKRSTRAIGRGFARVEPTTPDTLVAFAAKAGSTAADGDGANSPFTAALMTHLLTPGLDVRLALGRVRDEVMETTRPRQEPFVYGSLGGRTLSIVDAPANNPQTGPGPSVPQVVAPSPCAAAEVHWRSAESIGTRAAIEDHIKRFPDCVFVGLAKAKLAALTEIPAPPVQNEGEPLKRPGSYWDHNGSIVYLEASDSGSRKFYYSEPKSSIRAAGAQPGSLLFDGRKRGNRYEGKAYIFKGKCGAFAYDVSGEVSNNDETVVMTGIPPQIDSNCKSSSGHQSDRLEFSYKYRLN